MTTAGCVEAVTKAAAKPQQRTDGPSEEKRSKSASAVGMQVVMRAQATQIDFPMYRIQDRFMM